MVERVQAHQLAKFCQNRSIGCEDIKIFRFFKMAAATILYFQNREFLFAVNICRAQTDHCSKFLQNQSFRCGDITFFRIFKKAAAAILDFFAKFYRARQLYNNIFMLFLFPVKDGKLSTDVNITFNASCYG